MIIGVLSDTHTHGKTRQLPGVLLDRFRQVDHIIHAGDIGDLTVLRALERLAPVTAVAGNADTPEVHEALGEKMIVTLGGFRIGVFHGHGEKRKTLDRTAGAFPPEALHVIVFGHSHIPYCGYQEGMLLFNPGSPTDKRRNLYFSFGILEMDEVIRPRLVFFDAGGKQVSEITIT